MPKLFMLLIGCTPGERNIEQHDIYFAIGETIKDLIPGVLKFWPGDNRLHFDAWREITAVNGHKVTVIEKSKQANPQDFKLFFINLGGYKKDEFEEFHYKMVVAAENKGDAIAAAKKTAFFRHTGFEGATSHVDDKFGVDVDDIHEIADIIPADMKDKFSIKVDASADVSLSEDDLHLGYFKLSMFQ